MPPTLPVRRQRALSVCAPLLALVLWPLSTCDSLAGETAPRAARGAATQVERRLQQFARLGADRWHAAGYRGHGVKVAILDSGFRGYRAFLGKALPESVLVHSFRKDGNLEAKDSQHGILCGEVVHALAPEADLLFANWEADEPDQFLNAVRWAREQGARIISCSVIMPCWSDGEGGGQVHAALARILGKGSRVGDLLCFACAGNTALRTWSGQFHDGGVGFHEWLPGKQDNVLRPWGTEQVSIELYWPETADYDLTVFDVDTGAQVGRSAARSGVERRDAVVRFQPQPSHNYRARVRLARGSAGPFHLAALGAALECSTAKGSVSFPADGPEVIAVGAVGDDDQREPYSSCGPNSVQPKPDLVAPVPFASRVRSRPFAGTSAAAPQVAGLAALWWSRYPDWPAQRLRLALKESACDLGPPGYDCETGFGRVHLPPLEVAERLGELKQPSPDSLRARQTR